ncbi:MAG: SLBB domain-containing protein [Bacteroidetes bacterium]|nr:SLBB domain-containing protein [Bacteroidota bacterium]MCY4204514.1 SLBB domain-containing protein [Bacteroidota bacterium]
MYRLAIWGLAIFLLSPIAPVVRAQISGSQVLGSVTDTPQEEMRRVMMTRIGQSGILALEGSVDPNEYLVGPGDVFSVMVGGVPPMEIPLTVSVSGILSLPEVGLLRAGGRSLADVEKEALERLESHYANTSVSIALTQARSFYVHVTGAVTQTGRYLMLPRSRVSDVIQQSLSSGLVKTRRTTEDFQINFAVPDHEFKPEINDVYEPALRNIQVLHIDGTEDLIDFTRYQTTGNTDYNPVLQDGDRINVPAYHVIRDGIRIFGDVTWPGLYDWRPDDTIVSILDVAMGGRSLDEVDRFRIMRWNQGTYSVITDQTIQSLGTDSIATQLLMPGDHITVYERESATASIEGWVTYPGEYRIEGGVTTLTQLVKLAGGLKEGANPNGAVLERTSVDRLLDAPEIPLPLQEEASLRPIAVGADLAVQFTKGFQRSFSGEIGSHVAVDIAGALTGSGQDIVLYDGDRLVFPRDEGTVLVTGHVPQPGYVSFVPGMPASHYVDRAGGTGPATENIYVYGGSSGSVRRGEKEIVLPGDAVFVGWLEDLTVRNRQTRTQRTQIIVSSSISLAAILISVLSR